MYEKNYIFVLDLNIFILFHKIEAFTKQAIFLISDLLMARQPCDKAASLFFRSNYEYKMMKY